MHDGSAHHIVGSSETVADDGGADLGDEAFRAHQVVCIASMWVLYQGHLARWRQWKERDDLFSDPESARQRYLWLRHAAWSRHGLRQALRGGSWGRA